MYIVEKRNVVEEIWIRIWLRSDLWWPSNRQVCALSFPNKPGTNLRSLEGGKSWLIWMRNPNQESGARYSAPPPTALPRARPSYTSFWSRSDAMGKKGTHNGTSPHRSTMEWDRSTMEWDPPRCRYRLASWRSCEMREPQRRSSLFRAIAHIVRCSGQHDCPFSSFSVCRWRLVQYVLAAHVRMIGFVRWGAALQDFVVVC